MSDQKISKQQYNQQIKEWTQEMRRSLKSQISMMSSDGKKELVRSLRYKTKVQDKEIVKISFEFARHGVFWHYGVGRGYIREGGKVIRGRNASSFEKVLAARKNREAGKVLYSGNATIKRKPKEWFDPVYDKKIDSLGDILANYHGDDFFVEFDKMKIAK
jgi:hypothetical protein